MVRRTDRQGEVFIWYRKCSGCARHRMGPNLMNRCKAGQVGTEDYGKMLKRIQEKKRFLLRKRENGKLKDEKGGLPEESVDCGRNLRLAVSWLTMSYGRLTVGRREILA